MLNIAKCKQLLHNADNHKQYTDEEVAGIRDYLYLLAHIQIQLENNQSTKQRA